MIGLYNLYYLYKQKGKSTLDVYCMFTKRIFDFPVS